MKKIIIYSITTVVVLIHTSIGFSGSTNSCGNITITFDQLAFTTKTLQTSLTEAAKEVKEQGATPEEIICASLAIDGIVVSDVISSLVNAGFDHFHRETFGSSLEMGRDILQALGFRAHRAHRLAERFRKHDVASVSDMAKHAGDEEAFISETRKSRELLEQLMKEEHQDAPDESDEHWRAPPPDSKARG